MKPTKKPYTTPHADTDRFRGDTFWGKVNMKLKKLATAIEMFHGVKMNIDDVEYRWVDDRIERLEKDGRKLNKKEMQIANTYWKMYGRR